MKYEFNENEAKEVIKGYPSVPQALALRIYTSRLIGRNPDMVLHGGGNTSVKLKVKNILGDEEDILFVKGSGADLAVIGPEGFAGLELNFLQRLRTLENLTDEEMENLLRTHKTDANAPDPSVEALLHAFLPHKYIDHSHADSILILTHQKNGEKLVREVLGSKVSVVPYLKSGFPLAKGVMKCYESNPDAEAIAVMNHGIFTFGDDAETAYMRMSDYVSRADAYIQSKAIIQKTAVALQESDLKSKTARFVQTARGACAYPDKEGGLRRFCAEIRQERDIIDISLSKQASEICRSGVLTPDHAIRTKNQYVFIEHVPDDDESLKKSVTTAAETYKAEYGRYAQAHTKDKTVGQPDPFPRVFLVAGLGLVTLGFTRKDAEIAADIAEHTLRAKYISDTIGEYEPISESHVSDMEFWTLQQKKLGKAPIPALQGQIALVTGAGGAIGFGIADRLLHAGAVVMLTDIDETGLQKVRSILAERYGDSRVETIVFDVSDYSAVSEAFTEIGYRLGGIDILVPNAGLAHVSKIEHLEPAKFMQVVSVNLMGTFNVIKASVPVFRRQGTGGNIVVISTKNVFDPGAAFGAYSASKAAAHQISKIAALELAEMGVRVNLINPDAVFGDESVSSKLWDMIGPDRMKSRGLDPAGLKEYYRQRNLLKATVHAGHVGNAVVFFASDLTPTTGATLPVDGGNSAAFPR